MYILTKLSDFIRIPPNAFNIPIKESLQDEIHKKYSNKIIVNIGLAISVWDILDVKEGLLRPGDGGLFVEIQFRMIVWKPFIGEILEGTVLDCSLEGIKVNLGFFDEIFIPQSYLFENCEFKGVEKAWVWKPDEDTELFIDIGEKVRFRIEQEVFYNVKPKVGEVQEKTTPPYVIYASCQTDGMGCVSWWD